MDLLSAYVKTPQLIGIIAGIAVFSTTISVVVYLLFASGSLAKLVEELQSDVAPKSAADKKKRAEVHPQMSTIPELYDELIKARNSLSLRPTPPILTGKRVLIRRFLEQSDQAEITAISDGRAIFCESAYDPVRIWGWIDREVGGSAAKLAVAPESPNSGSFVIVDIELNRPIGMISLVDNCPTNLSIRIANIWLTPAFQGQKRSHETFLLLLEWLITSGYRRITAEVDERNVIARRLLERCGFELEAILRKHRIVQNRNSNTALYTVLNSDWIDVERKLKTFLGISLTPVLHKIAEIDTLARVKNGSAEKNEKGDEVVGVEVKKNKKKNKKIKK